MQGGNHQKGGFDPALAALLASLFSGGIAAYGYKTAAATETTSAADSLRSEYETKLANAATATADAAKDKADLEAKDKALAALTTQVNTLEAEKKKLESERKSLSDDALTFKSAGSQALKAAISGVLSGLGANPKYNHLVDPPEKAKAITKVLEYPTTYQSKLDGLTLPIFYEKRVRPLFEQLTAQKGGRGRRRQRGGRAKDAKEAIDNYSKLIDALAREPTRRGLSVALQLARRDAMLFPESSEYVRANGPPVATVPGSASAPPPPVPGVGSDEAVATEADALVEEIGAAVAAANAAPGPGEAAAGPEEMAAADLEAAKNARLAVLGKLGVPIRATPGAAAGVVPSAPPPVPGPPGITAEELVNANTTLGVPGAPGSAAAYGRSGIPSYDEFAALYASAIRAATLTPADQVAQRPSKVVSDVDRKKAEAAANKAAAAQAKADAAAKTIAEKYALQIGTAYMNATQDINPYSQLHTTLDPTHRRAADASAKRLGDLIALAQVYVPIADYETLAKKELDEEDEADAAGVAAALIGMGTYTQVQGGARWPFSSSKVDTTPLPKELPLYTTITTQADLEGVRDIASKLPGMIEAAAKEYIKDVKAAAKEETKDLTDLGRRSFIKVTIPFSPSNMFAGLVKKLTDPSKSYTDAEAAALAREDTVKKVEFIKTIFKSVDPVLKELAVLQKRKKGGRVRKVRGGQGPSKASATESAEERCAAIRKDPRFEGGETAYIRKAVKAIAYGGETLDGIEWVAEKPKNDTQKSSLKFLLDRLNTGLFSRTADYLKGIRGKEVTYTLDDVVSAGEAYILLRCYLKKAAEMVRTLRGSESVLQNLQSTLRETREESEPMKAARGTIITGIEEELKKLTNRQRKIGDLSVAIAKKRNEIGDTSETSALKGVLNDLEMASTLLRTLRKSDVAVSFEGSNTLLDGKTTEDLEAARADFAKRTQAYMTAAAETYKVVDPILIKAERDAQPRVKGALSQSVIDAVSAATAPPASGLSTPSDPGSVRASPGLGPRALTPGQVAAAAAAAAAGPESAISLPKAASAVRRLAKAQKQARKTAEAEALKKAIAKARVRGRKQATAAWLADLEEEEAARSARSAQPGPNGNADVRGAEPGAGTGLFTEPGPKGNAEVRGAEPAADRTSRYGKGRTRRRKARNSTLKTRRGGK